MTLPNSLPTPLTVENLDAAGSISPEDLGLPALVDIIRQEGERLAPTQTAAVIAVVAPWADYAKAIVAFIAGFVIPAAGTLTAGALSNGVSASEALTAIVAGLVGSGLIGGGVYGIPNSSVKKELEG